MATKKNIETPEIQAEVTSETTAEATPKKRGRKPKDETAIPKTTKKTTTKKTDDTNKEESKKTSNAKYSAWSGARKAQLTLCKDFMYIEVRLLRPALGMMPSNPDILDAYISTKDPNAPSITDEVLMGRSVEELADSKTTIWPMGLFYRDPDTGYLIDTNDPGTEQWIRDIPKDDPRIIRAPYLFDYQLRGMYKDSCGLLSRAKSNLSADLRAYKKIIDGAIFIEARHNAFEMPARWINEDGILVNTYDENGNLFTMQRPLRTSGPSGEHTAIASSEVIPAGSTMKFKVCMTSPEYRKNVCEWLDYGLLHGIGQWRNSGIGIFEWRELDENWQPIE